MDRDNPNWLQVKRRLDPEYSTRYNRILLKPDPDCADCAGTGISKHKYDCGARNCTGHGDIICGCRELQLDCPYQSDHPNTFGNWTTKYENGIVYVECYDAKEHQPNTKLYNNAQVHIGSFLNGDMLTIRFDVADLNAIHDPDLCDGSNNCKCDCYSCKSLRGSY